MLIVFALYCASRCVVERGDQQINCLDRFMPSVKYHFFEPESEALDKSVAKREQDCPLGGCNTTLKPPVGQSGELIRCLQKRLIYSIRRHLVWLPVFPPSSAFARPIKMGDGIPLDAPPS